MLVLIHFAFFMLTGMKSDRSEDGSIRMKVFAVELALQIYLLELGGIMYIY